jgi:hypothetical protein
MRYYWPRIKYAQVAAEHHVILAPYHLWHTGHPASHWLPAEIRSSIMQT